MRFLRVCCRELAPSVRSFCVSAVFLEKKVTEAFSPQTLGLNDRVNERSALQQMHAVMRHDPHCVSLHKELLLSLAKGDVEASSDIAGLLAARIKKHTCSQAIRCDSLAPEICDTEKENMVHSQVSIDDAVDKLAQSIEASVISRKKPESGITPDSEVSITIIDSNFELPDYDSDGVADDTAMKVLSQYLSSEADCEAWKAQKRAVAKTILDAAKLSGISSEILVQSDVANNAGLSLRFNPFKECNIIVRCEVPDATDADSKEVVENQLKEMQSLPGWDPKAEQIARKELMLGLVSNRYKVGLHRSLESVLGPERSRSFVVAAMEALNNPIEDIRGSLLIPSTPFTYMLRLCLWTEDTAVSTVAAAAVGIPHSNNAV